MNGVITFLIAAGICLGADTSPDKWVKNTTTSGGWSNALTISGGYTSTTWQLFDNHRLKASISNSFAENNLYVLYDSQEKVIAKFDDLAAAKMFGESYIEHSCQGIVFPGGTLMGNGITGVIPISNK